MTKSSAKVLPSQLLVETVVSTTLAPEHEPRRQPDKKPDQNNRQQLLAKRQVLLNDKRLVSFGKMEIGPAGLNPASKQMVQIPEKRINATRTQDRKRS